MAKKTKKTEEITKNRHYEYAKLKSEFDKFKENNKEIIDKKEFENIMLRSSISKRDKFIEKMGMEKSFDKFIYEEVKKEVKTLKKSSQKIFDFDLEL